MGLVCIVLGKLYGRLAIACSHCTERKQPLVEGIHVVILTIPQVQPMQFSFRPFITDTIGFPSVILSEAEVMVPSAIYSERG